MRRNPDWLRHLLGIAVCFAASCACGYAAQHILWALVSIGNQLEAVVALLWLMVLYVPGFVAMDAALGLLQHGLVRFKVKALNIVLGVLFYVVKAIYALGLLGICAIFLLNMMSMGLPKPALALAVLYVAAVVIGFVGVRVMNRGLKAQWLDD